MSLVQLGLLDAAYGEVVRALQIDPDHGAARNTLGQVFLGRGDAAGALEQFRIAVRLNPDQPVRHLNEALALGRLGRIAEACAAWQRYFALETDPDRAARSRPQALGQGCAAR